MSCAFMAVIQNDVMMRTCTRTWSLCSCWTSVSRLSMKITGAQGPSEHNHQMFFETRVILDTTYTWENWLYVFQVFEIHRISKLRWFTCPQWLSSWGSVRNPREHVHGDLWPLWSRSWVFSSVWRDDQDALSSTRYWSAVPSVPERTERYHRSLWREVSYGKSYELAIRLGSCCLCWRCAFSWN